MPNRLTRPTTPYGGINPYGDKKANGQVSDFLMSYGNISHYQNTPHIKTHAEFRPKQFQNIPFKYKQSNTMKGFANETACVNRILIWHVCIYMKLSIEPIHIKV